MSFLGIDFGSSGLGKTAVCGLALILVGNMAVKTVRGKIERGIKQALPQTIGPAESYNVHVSAGIGSLLSSKLDRVTIIGKEVYLKKKAEVETLNIDMKGIRFDAHKSSFKSAEGATVKLTMRDDQMERYLTKKYPDFIDFKCKLSPGKFYLQVKPQLAGFSLPVDSYGDFRISGKDAISVDLDKVTTAGLEVPGFVTKFVMNRFNPVLEASEFGLKATFTKATIEEGKANLEADLDLSQGFETE